MCVLVISYIITLRVCLGFMALALATVGLQRLVHYNDVKSDLVFKKTQLLLTLAFRLDLMVRCRISNKDEVKAVN